MNECIPARTGVGWDDCDEHHGPKHKGCVNSAHAPLNLFESANHTTSESQEIAAYERSYRVFDNAFAVVLCGWLIDPARTPYPIIGESMRLNTLDLVLAACPPGWRGRAFLSLGEKNEKSSKDYIPV